MCRRAAEVSKVHGKLSCLMINDLDAGIGHFENTQVGSEPRWCVLQLASAVAMLLLAAQLLASCATTWMRG